MATEIKVPVRLEVLQDSINNIKSALANIKPESGAWRTLNTILQGLTREADKLQITMSKPFTNQSQFTNAEKSIEKMEEGLDRARIAMSRIKFSDIKLTPEQTNAFNNLKTELKSIEQEINQFKVNAKAALQNDDVWKDFMKIDPNAATRTFDQLLTMVRRKNSELQKEVQEAELALNSFKAQNENKMNNTQQLIDGKKIKDMLGEEYSNFFKTTGAFKNQDSKNSFYEWIKTNFVLDDNQIAELAKASGPKLDTVIQGMKEQLQEKLKALQLEQNSKQLKFDTNKEQLDSATKAAAAMGQAVDDLAGKQSNLKSREDELAASTQKLEASITNAARSNDNFNNATSQMNMQLTNLKNTLGSANAQFLQMQRTTQSFNQMKMAVVNFMGFNQVLNLTKRAVRDAMNHIKELDTVMTKISIVTDMSTGDLWNQIDSYSQMAQRYGVSIKGAYEVSQIYYQQGLDTSDVMTLTNETLKLAKISGLDYAKTTDYMTTALRGFKMEMSEAATVVDVYSNLAAHTAVSQEELAVAMSKTASSMQGVGVTFQDASAMIGTMVAVTRESATNIGSAMKSIASRYGELTKDPTKLVDEEGEAMAFNKVDAALQSVGISMKTTDGQFRDFTSVIVELGEKWDQLDSVQQRYIATQFAGNRQQSRFLALVSNVDLLKQNMQYAEDSEDIGTLQALKALDSIEAKTEQVRVAYQQMYTTIGAEDIWKGFLDGVKNVMNTLNSLPKLFGKVPLGAIAMAADFVKVIKDIGLTALGGLSKIMNAILPDNFMAQKGQEAGNAFGQNVIDALHKVLPAVKEAGKEIATETGKGGEQAGKDATNPAKPTTETQQMQVAAPAETAGAEAVKQAQAEAQATGGIHIPVQIDFDLGEFTSKLNDATNISDKQIRANINFALNLDVIDMDFLPQLQSAISQIDFSLPDASDKLQAWINSYIAQAGELGTELQDEFQQAGPNAVQGLVEGLIGSSGNATASAATIGAAVIAALNAAMGCHSPSVFAKLSGENVIAGIAEGIASAAQDAVNKASETGQNVMEALKSGMEFDNSSFELFKQGILKEINSLGDEVTETEKTVMRGIAQNMSLEEFQDHMASDEFYQFAGLYKKAFIDAGLQHTYNLMDQSVADTKPKILQIGEDGLTAEQRSQKESRLAEIQTNASARIENINKELSPITSEIGELQIRQKDALDAKMQDWTENYRKLNQRNPDAAELIEHQMGLSPIGSRFSEADAERLDQLQRRATQLEKERDSIKKTADTEQQEVRTQYQNFAKENRNQVKQATDETQVINDRIDKDKRELAQQALNIKTGITSNVDKEIAKVNLREEAIYGKQALIEQDRNPSVEIKNADYRKAIDQVREENENKEGRETEFTVKPQLDQAATDAIPPEASTKITSDLAENPPKITKIEGGQEQASTTGSEISETIQENISPVETQITDTKASEEGTEAGESFKEGVESTPPAEGKIDATEKAAEEGTKAGETFRENVENATPATPKIEAPQEQQQTTPPEAQQPQPQQPVQAPAPSPAPEQPSPPPVQPPEVDTSAQVAQVQALVDKLVEAGVISEETGEKMKAGLAKPGVTAEELAQKQKQYNNQLKMGAAAAEQTGGALQNLGSKMSGFNFGTFGSAIRMLASLSGISQQAKGAITAVGGAITLLGVAISMVDKKSKQAAATNPWMAIAMGIMAVWNGISMLYESDEEKIERLNKEAEELNNTAKEFKANYKTLDKGSKKLEELKEKRYESAEAAEEYQSAVDELAEKFPELVSGFDEAGNIIIQTADMERVLTDARKASAEATYDAAKAELEAMKAKRQKAFNDLQGSLTMDQLSNLGLSDTIGTQRVEFLKQQLEARGQDYDTMFGGYEFGTNGPSYGQFIEAIKAYNSEYAGTNPIKIEDFVPDYSKDNLGETITDQSVIEARRLTGEVHDLYSQILYLDKETLAGEQGASLITQLHDKLVEIKTRGGIGEDTDLSIDNIDAMIKKLSDFNSQVSEYKTLMSQLAGLNRSVISGWVNKNNTNSKFLSSSYASSMIANAINTVGFERYAASQNAGLSADDYDRNDVNIEAVDTQSKFTIIAEQFFSHLNDEEIKLFDQMTSDASTYTAEDFQAEFKNVYGFEDFYTNILAPYYSDSIKSIQDRLTKNLSQVLNKTETQLKDYDKLQGVEKELAWYINFALTETEASVLEKIYKQYDDIKDAGYLKRANEFGTAATQLFGEISKAPAEIQKALWKVILDSGLDTKEDIQSIKTLIQNNAEYSKYVNTSNLDTMYNTMISNIGLSIQSATSDLLESWDTTNKDLKAALSGGVSLKDADSLISKAQALGLTDFSLSSSFEWNGDKLVMTSEAFKAYWQQLNNATGVNAEEWQAIINRATVIIGKIGSAGLSTLGLVEQDWIDLASIGFDKNDVDAMGNLSVEAMAKLATLRDNAQKGLDNYNEAAAIASDQLLKESERLKGEYTKKLSEEQYTEAELRDIASDFHLDKTDWDKIAAKSHLNEVYENLISDVLSKSFDNIRLDDYQGLLNGGKNIKLSGSYEQFVKKYGDFLGYTVDEMNNLILEARDKDHERFSEDLIKDLTFYNDKQFQASEATMRDMANAFDVPMQQLMASGAMVFDEATRRYIVDIDKLKDEGIDLTQVDNFKQTVQESVDQMFSDTATGIKNALKGSLNAKGVKSLMDNLKGFGLDVDLAFTRTKDGYKIAVDEAQKLYDELKQIDTISSEIVLDALNESIEESVTGARVLNKEIQALRATTESDDFKFMDNDIPSGQKNPLNYAENWAKAIQTMQDAFDKTKHKGTKAGGLDSTYGMIDYQDWYNIANELGNIANISKQKFTVAGVEIDGSLEQTAALIQKGAESLTAVDAGKMMVNLQGIGLDFSTGADGLKNNIDLGIDAVADSQIAMLDSMIQLLETIVAMEALGDIDVEGNGIDFEEMFSETYEADDGTQMWKWSEGMQKAADNILKQAEELGPDSDLYKGLENVKTNGVSMRKIFEQARDGIDMTNDEAVAYHATVAAFYKAMQSGDWSTDNIMDSIKQILAGTNFEGDIEVGELKLTFHQGVAFERDKDGNYLVDGKPFKNLDAALRAQQTGTIAALQGLTKTYNEETGNVTYKAGNIEVATEYDIKNKQFTAKFSDGGSVIASSQEELSAAIRTYLLTQNINLSNESGQNITDTSSVLKYSITRPGEATVDVELDVKTGKVTVKNQDSNLPMDDKTATNLGLIEKTVTENQEEIINVTYTGDATGAKEAGKEAEEAADAADEKNPTIKVNDEASKVIKEIEKELDELAKKEYNVTVKATVESDEKKSEGNGSTNNGLGSGAHEFEEAENTLNRIADAGENVSINLEDDMKLFLDAIKQIISVASSGADGVYGFADAMQDLAAKAIAATLLIGINSKLNSNNASGTVTSPETMEQELVGVITNYIVSPEVNDPSEFINNLTATVSKYIQADNVELPEIEDVTQNVVLNTNQIKEVLNQNVTDGLSTLVGQDVGVGTNDIPSILAANVQAGKINPVKQEIKYITVTEKVEETPVKTAEDRNAKTRQNARLQQQGFGVDITATDNATSTLEKVESKVNDFSSTEAQKIITADDTDVLEKVDETKESLESIPNPTVNINGDASSATSAAENVQDAIDALVNGSPYSIEIEVSSSGDVPSSEGGTSDTSTKTGTKAKGNVALATGTLMGELGPELVVSGGRYFVVGQNGAEFVDLEDDAIVFNHLQTQQLLKNGMAPSRGKALTSEKNAIAFAQGHMGGGPAMASAREALAALKQLREMWKALKSASVKDLAGKGGGGGGGGGGKTDTPERKAWIEAVERWYNLMQQIAELEREITHEEALRTKLQSDWQKNGKAYYASQKASLQALEKQTIAQMQLNIDQEDYFNQRREKLNESQFKRLYTFDENGTLQYNNKDLGFAWLSDLVAQDEYGNTKYTNEEQYNRIVAQGYGAYMQQDSSGALIEMEKDENGNLKEDQSAYYAKAIEAWWDTINSQKEEMESLHETIEEGKTKVLELENSRNEILNEIRNNQMEVEEKVLAAIESSRQREIDALSEERKLLQESADKYIEGLNESLNKEREMYERNQSDEELNRKQRQLDILRRSGGSGSQIRSLESEISGMQKDSYFDQQQTEIDAIKEASDLQLEKMDQQIEIMTQTLEYQKTMGLLWGDVYTVMAGTPTEITEFIMTHDSEFWNDSPLKTEDQFQEAFFAADQWTAFRDDQAEAYNQDYISHTEDLATMQDAVYGNGSNYNWGIFNESMKRLYGDQWEEVANKYKGQFMSTYAQSGDITKASSDICSALSGFSSSMTSALNNAYSGGNYSTSGPSGGSSGGSGGSGGSTGGNNNSGGGTKYGYKFKDSNANKTYDSGKIYSSKSEAVTYGTSMRNNVVAYYRDRNEYQKLGNVGSVSAYKLGGLNDYTGLAMLHGTKSKPESVLTAEQTRVLRKDILGSQPNSLMNLLLDFRSAMSGMASQSDYNTIDRSASMIIENATVNMNVSSIANDYDARRAGEQALSEMMRIARKTSAKNSVGR